MITISTWIDGSLTVTDLTLADFTIDESILYITAHTDNHIGIEGYWDRDEYETFLLDAYDESVNHPTVQRLLDYALRGRLLPDIDHSFSESRAFPCI